ncbi:MAG: biotin transporter BioY [Sphaerochaetaceae bacterium]|nr:biotin transporter BioY [Sphaerochaetaceae bacterium]MDC7247949.1 biotin transporter BioY [Sphaerochaetaceae bacterium]
MAVRNVIITSLFTALIIVGSFIIIPVTVVPVTLQTLFVLLAGVLAGRKTALTSTSLYLVLGAVGLPVFSGASGGLAHYFGPTGGFLIGMLLMAAISGAAGDAAMKYQNEDQTLMKKGLVILILGSFAATVSIYLVGIPFIKFNLDLTWPKAFATAMIPFIPGDLLKLVVVIIVSNIFFPRVRSYLAVKDE